MTIQVFAFAKVDDQDAMLKIYEEIKNGKSRFGMWDQKVSLREEWFGKNASLLRIKKEDWIVHVNMPSYGKCVAVQCIGEYAFDEGVDIYGDHSWVDYNNFIPVNPDTLIEFDRRDNTVLPSVNLAPRRRIQRVLQVDDFIQSLENLKTKRYNSENKKNRSDIHLKEKVSALLPQISSQIHEMNKSKEFERFLHRIFDKMPNTTSIQNGFGWKTDHGADLIVEFENPIIGVNVTTKLIVQAKSYEGSHYDKNAVDQIVEGIERYEADAGLLITTADETEELEEYVREKSEEIDKTIDVIAGPDVAKFVIRYAPELLIGEK